MLIKTIPVLTLLLLASFTFCSSAQLSCYACFDCAKEYTDLIQNCPHNKANFCKMETSFKGLLTHTLKSCANECQDKKTAHTNLLGFTEIECCQTNLCNVYISSDESTTTSFLNQIPKKDNHLNNNTVLLRNNSGKHLSFNFKNLLITFYLYLNKLFYL